jgi:hypothetical protein
MPKRPNDENREGQSQKRAKLTLQDIEENSIDQLLAQPSQASKKSLKKLLAANNEEIVRLGKLNKKILKCLDRIDQQNQSQENTCKVSLIHNFSSIFNFYFFRRHLAGPNCRRKFGFECSRICQ